MHANQILYQLKCAPNPVTNFSIDSSYMQFKVRKYKVLHSKALLIQILQPLLHAQSQPCLCRVIQPYVITCVCVHKEYSTYISSPAFIGRIYIQLNQIVYKNSQWNDCPYLSRKHSVCERPLPRIQNQMTLSHAPSGWTQSIQPLLPPPRSSPCMLVTPHPQQRGA